MSADQVPPQFPNYFELFQNIVNPFAAGAGAGSAANPAAMMMASLDPKEIARKQQELETVLMWLRAQVGVVEMSLKTLEYQKSMLEQIAKGGAASAPDGSAKTAAPNMEELAKMAGAMNPAAWAWNMMQQPAAASETGDKKPRANAKKSRR
ncbi:MAG TPA: PhaM family polyhydroxyalkanoate granule multifunctional regulatory protein [Usitatibacteraceae bacterium]